MNDQAANSDFYNGWPSYTCSKCQTDHYEGTLDFDDHIHLAVTAVRRTPWIRIPLGTRLALRPVARTLSLRQREIMRKIARKQKPRVTGDDLRVLVEAGFVRPVRVGMVYRRTSYKLTELGEYAAGRYAAAHETQTSR